MLAVLSGLSITIILLAINRKALPALPISITFGILFYLVSAIVLQPFVNSLTVVPPKELGASGLWLGKTDGFTTFFV